MAAEVFPFADDQLPAGWSPTKRLTVPEAELLIGEEFKCLDQGFVRLVDYSGGDARVVQSARVSYGAGTKTVREDQGLINYLIENHHTSPLEQVNLLFHIKLPLFVFAQLVRTRTAKLNAMSARYSVMADEFYFPAPVELRAQSNRNKQVGEGEVDGAVAEQFLSALKNTCRLDYDNYQEFLEKGVARELGRMVLPQNLYTQIYWQIDLNNLFKTLKLRLDWHAQYEFRVYAYQFARLAKAVAPMCYQAFEEFILDGCSLSRTELAAVRRVMAGGANPLDEKQTRKLRLKLGIDTEDNP